MGVATGGRSASTVLRGGVLLRSVENIT